MQVIRHLLKMEAVDSIRTLSRYQFGPNFNVFIRLLHRITIISSLNREISR